MRFRSKWKQALIIAVALHIVFIGIFGFLVPWIDGQAADKAPEPTVEFASGDGTDGDGGSGDSEQQDQDEQKEEEKPEEQQPVTPEPSPVTPVPETITSPVTASDPYNAIAKKTSEGETAEPKSGNGRDSGKKGGGKGQKKGNPPITEKTFYPPKGIVKFKGYITVQSLVGTNGKVTKVKLMTPVRDRKNPESAKVNKLAEEYAMKWLFKPATDENDNPIPAYKNISIPFNALPKVEKE